MYITLCSVYTTLFATVAASPLVLQPRQSPTWQYSCSNRAAPGNFKAFNLDGCTAQLSFDKDRYIGVRWAFEATYADGSRVTYEPVGSTNFGASDVFYPFLGNNFITRFPGSSAFTAVHEFSNVCKNGQTPVSWRFYTTSANSACSASSYRYTTGQIIAVGGLSRPAKVAGVALSRSSDAGDFTVSWSASSAAAAYSVIVQYPTGVDDLGDPYLNVRGARVQGSSTSVATTTRQPDVQRQAIVHTINAQGLWSYTLDVQPVVANW